MKRAWALLQKSFDADDLPIVVFFFALVLLGYGLSQFHRGLGFAVDGFLLMLYVRPLSRMIK